MRKLILSLIVSVPLITISSASLAKNQTYGHARVAEVTSIYDADTFRVNIDGWPAIIGHRIPIRVRGVDAPEIRGKCDSEIAAARAAKQFTVSALRNAERIELLNLGRDKYFRINADVRIDGYDLAGGLIKAGHARKYDGGKRGSWCN